MYKKRHIQDGIYFNEKHSSIDFGAICSYRKIGFPKKTKIKEKVPFSNRILDFSMIYGFQPYEERELEYTFTLADAPDVYALERQKIAFVNWLEGLSGQTKLTDDAIKGYYFLAEVEQIDVDYKSRIAEVGVTFICYPFKIGEMKEGHDIWDDFDFELDIAQDVEFTVESKKTITIYNIGATPVNPVVTCSKTMNITLDSTTYQFPVGTTESDKFSLSVGANKMTIQGTGIIKFTFHKELI